jgi:hypothetical protein
MTSTEVLDDLTDLVAPEGLPDLTQAEIARSLPLAVLSLAIGQTTPYLEEFLANPTNRDTLQALDRFQRWCDDSAGASGRDAWLVYLADCRATVLKETWAAYDPQAQVDDEVRETVGDEMLGASIWFSHLQAINEISERDGTRWSSLRHYLIVSDLFSDDEEAPETSSEGRADEW